MHVVATAGHVDHGKSTLIKTLTGTDPDRLEEEKARGLTIDLGFAGTKLPSGRGVSFIDVPGHVRFLKNMLAGVGGVDACLFVVAATEGWKPQSEEHLRILSLLGIAHGVIALTKVGQADDDLVELAQMEIAERTEGTFLADAEIVPVDAIDGVGVAPLGEALDRLLEVTPTATDLKQPRLWIDRVFAAKGAGTVVTGTLTGGMLRVDDELVVLPGGHEVRVRALQSQYADRTKVGPGNRVAANLSGVSYDLLSRGDVLVRNGDWHVTRRVDASLQVLGSLDRPVTRRGAHLAYIGSGEHPVRVRVLGPDAIDPGVEGAVRFHLPVGLPLVPGDRFILRESGQGVTLGGGEILDVDPLVTAAKAKPDRDVDRVVRERGKVDVEHLRRLTGEHRAPTVGNWVVDPDMLTAEADRLRTEIADAGPLGLDLARVDNFGRAVLETLVDLVTDGGHVRSAATGDALAESDLVARFAADPFNPPDPEPGEQAEIRELIRRGDLVSQSGVVFAASAIDEAARVVARLLADQPDGITVADARDAWGTTRKFAIPLITRLDETGVTRRREDLRIAGPRLPKI
jgi:selenocysteine-specific elongation factor